MSDSKEAKNVVEGYAANRNTRPFRSRRGVVLKDWDDPYDVSEESRELWSRLSARQSELARNARQVRYEDPEIIFVLFDRVVREKLGEA